MAVKTFYTLNTSNANWGQLQEGGSAPAAAASAYGWGNAKVAAAYWRGRVGATATASVSAASTYLTTTVPQQGTGTGATAASNAFRSPTTYFGNFANTAWSFSFGVRTGTASHAGRIRIQIWKGANADGSGATKVGGVGIGSIATLAATNTTYTTSGTVAAPGVITLANEYLFFEVEWQGTTAGTSNGCSTLFYQGVCTVTTPDFTNTLNILDPNDYTTPAPTLQTAAITQVHALTDLDLVAPAPVLEDADLVEISAAFPTVPLVAPAPVLQTATLTQLHAVVANGLTAPTPTFGAPPLGVTRNLTASNYTTPTPVLATPTTFTQKHVVAGSTLLTPAPTFTAPSLMLVSALKLGDRVLDNGLAALDTEADKIYICNNFPTTFIEATSTFALGNKNFGVGQVFSPPSAGAPKGRVVMSNSVSGGTISAAGMPQCWAVVDTVNARLLAIGPASGFIAVSLQWTWTLGSIPIHMDG